MVNVIQTQEYVIVVLALVEKCVIKFYVKVIVKMAAIVRMELVFVLKDGGNIY